jgi:hypothetical protein
VDRRLRYAPLVALAGVAGALGLAPAAMADPPVWRAEQPPPPPGAVFKVPIGAPGDIQCYQRNRCLLMNEGNSTVPQGIFDWNGASWHQFATVCGSPAGVARLAFGGPGDVWTVTAPSLPRTGAGQSLCHIQNGRVTGSFSTAPQASDPYRLMDSATCNGPNDCWFGGPGASDGAGTRKGAFHLHWDGSQLSTVYGVDGRGVTDMQASGGSVWEGVVQGKASGNVSEDADPPGTALLHHIVGTGISVDPFTPSPGPGSPPEGADILALDSNGQELWAAGGFTSSGTAAHPDTPPHRGPLLLHYVAGAWQELHLDPALFGPDDRFVDVAAVPGTTDAWVAVQPYSQRAATNAPATVALVHADGSASLTTIPTSGSGRGTAAKVEFSAPNDGWLVTNAGWIFHYTDGEAVPVDDDPSYQGTITFRPNEAAAQFVPDRPPPDDSLLFAPAPPAPQTSTQSDQTTPKKLPALLKKIKASYRGRRLLVIKFVLAREASIGLVAYHRKKVVARVKPRDLRPGRRSLKIRVNPKRPPTRFKWQIKEKGQPQDGSTGDGSTGGGGDTVTT